MVYSSFVCRGAWVFVCMYATWAMLFYVAWYTDFGWYNVDVQVRYQSSCSFFHSFFLYTNKQQRLHNNRINIKYESAILGNRLMGAIFSLLPFYTLFLSLFLYFYLPAVVRGDTSLGSSYVVFVVVFARFMIFFSLFSRFNFLWCLNFCSPILHYFWLVIIIRYIQRVCTFRILFDLFFLFCKVCVDVCVCVCPALSHELFYLAWLTFSH